MRVNDTKKQENIERHDEKQGANSSSAWTSKPKTASWTRHGQVGQGEGAQGSHRLSQSVAVALQADWDPGAQDLRGQWPLNDHTPVCFTSRRSCIWARPLRATNVLVVVDVIAVVDVKKDDVDGKSGKIVL